MEDDLLTTTVDEENQLITFRLTGRAPSRDYTDRMLDAYSRIPDVWRYNRLIDHRRFRGFITFEDLQRIQQFWAETMADRTDKPFVALVTRDPLAHARMSASGNMFVDAHFRSFTSMHQALSWVGQTQALAISI